MRQICKRSRQRRSVKLAAARQHVSEQDKNQPEYPHHWFWAELGGVQVTSPDRVRGGRPTPESVRLLETFDANERRCRATECGEGMGQG